MKFRIFSDGSSRGNPGPGGWAAIVCGDVGVQEFGGFDIHTTNNRMELTGAIQGLHNTPRASLVEIVTDSSYVIKGMKEWLSGWEARNWKTRTGDDVVNRDLWEALALLVRARTVSWKQVKGHAGNPGNERCDEIATGYALQKPVSLFSGARSAYSIDIETIGTDGEGSEKGGTSKLSQSKSSSSKAAYSYISMVNGVIQTHATWAECEARVKGVSGAKFKKAVSESQETLIISEYKKVMKKL